MTIAQDIDFLEAYYRHVAAADLADRTAEDVRAAGTAHRRIAALRPPGTVLVRVYRPDAERDGWSAGVTVVDVVTDDMPFLVDSILAELTGRHLSVALLVHPQLHVERDAEGRLSSVVGAAGDEDAAGDESWIHVEIPPLDDDEMQVLARDLRKILDDVASAVGDWSAMRAMAATIAAGLSDEPGMPGDETNEAVQLLRWMTEDHFTFLGYREYVFLDETEPTLVPKPGSGLGILRGHSRRSRGTLLTAGAAQQARERRALVITKANSLSTVQRRVHLDYVGIKVFDAQGRAIGERRFVGLFSSSAYVESVRRIPLLRQKVDVVLHRAGVSSRSHSGKQLLQLLETYPRDELFQVDVEHLFTTLQEVANLGERRRLRLFVRRDAYDRFLSCLVYLPRDRYTTDVRERISAVLLAAAEGDSIEFTARVTESVLARLHFVVRSTPGRSPREVDVERLEQQLTEATREWDDRLTETLGHQPDGDRLAQLYGSAFPEAYKEDVAVTGALADVALLDAADADRTAVITSVSPAEDADDVIRFVLYRFTPVSLSLVLPMLARFGVEITDERPYHLHRGDGVECWIYSFGLRSPDLAAAGDRLALLRDAYAAISEGRAEDDGFNGLVLAAGLSWRQVSVLRAYWRYERQIDYAYGQDYAERVVLAHPQICSGLLELFETRFDPDFTGDRDEAQSELGQLIERLLDEVANLDADRILREVLTLLRASTRTNYFRRDGDGRARDFLSIKFDSTAIPDLPFPRPKYEIFVCAPEVEGVHLRMGAVARGGLRWSDRPEDFRTEILGLVKAQAVKNAVIVPAGAKGGFVVKRPVVGDDATSQGIACYSIFVRGLLDVTDNRVNGTVVGPDRVLRHDGDDAYLVVAADKGTARFSDTANAISSDYGFWLGDAFASGGSAGYDHKAMGITARGAWESVKRHMLELGVDTQTQDFTVAGIGDMSGDVFGNSMLLSPHIRLVAAFDHRHIFLDPDADAIRSCDERARLFGLDRSSWGDYDRSLISHGGGVFSRSAKHIDVTPEVRRLLGLPTATTSLTPGELVHAILLAPVDVLYNGGIGTYVKASSQSHLDVGDKANDGVRVDGRELRCKVVGEGGNLGLTQAARIEAAVAGVRLNTDAIDNSAGVDTSDHEVNIKILFDLAHVAVDDRNAALAAATDEVAAAVLTHNYRQNMVLAVERNQAPALLEVNERFMRELESAAHLDRRLEALPLAEDVRDRQAAGAGLANPEDCVLLAYSKMWLQASLLESDLPDEPFFDRVLRGYFPAQLSSRFADELVTHPLRREIVATGVANDIVDRGGIAFVFGACEETGASAVDVTRAATITRSLFDLDGIWASIDALDNTGMTAGQALAHLATRRLLDRATRWWLQDRQRTDALDVAAAVARYGPTISSLLPHLPDLFGGDAHDDWLVRTRRLTDEGVPSQLAGRIAALLDAVALLEVVGVADQAGVEPREVARVLLQVMESFDVDPFLTRVTSLPRRDRWQSMVRSSMRYDAYAAVADIAIAVLATTSSDDDAVTRVEEWIQANDNVLARSLTTVRQVLTSPTSDLAALSIALRALRVRTS